MGNRQRGNWRTFWGLASTALWLIPGAGATAFVLKSLAVGAANILINALLPMLPGKGPDSPAYSWKHEPNLPANADIAMPIVYGKTRVKPVIKSRHVRLDGTKQYLDVLYSFTGHRVDERAVDPWVADKSYVLDNEVTTSSYPGRTYKCVFPHKSSDPAILYEPRFWKLGHGTAYNTGISDITIDNNPIESYVTATPDIFTFETRAGAAQQAFIAGFDTSYDNYPQGVVINIPEPTIAFNTASIFLKELETGGNQYWIEWQEHDLLYFGTYYKIEKGKTIWEILPEPTSETPLCVLWILGASKYTLRSIKPTEIPDGYHLVTYFIRLIPEPSTKRYIIDDFKTSSIVLSNIHNIELIFDFPRGLYSFDWTNQQTENDTATIKAKYREVGTPQWFPFEQILNWKETGVKTTYNLENGLSISANKTESFSVSWSAKDKDVYLLTDKHYEVQYEAISAQIVELANVAGVTYSKPDDDGQYRPHTYPGECLLGIKAMATGYLQGGFEVTAVINRSKVKVYSHELDEWLDQPANCHAFAVYDMLVNGWSGHPQYPNMVNLASIIQPVYGCGIDPDRIDSASFQDWMTHTYTMLGFRLNTVFDTTMTIWDAISRVCEEGLAVIIPIGSEFRALVDKPALPTEINSLFCMGNINEGTFQQSWVDRSKKARSIETSFANAERTPPYTESTFTVRIPEWDTVDEQDSPLSMTLYGTTDYTQALGIAKYRLNCNYLLSQMIVFETDIEAMEVEVGDVIPVQHDTLCGAGGRLAGVDYNLLINPSAEDTTIDPWEKWSSPTTWGKTTILHKYGNWSLYTKSTSNNGGMQQTFTVKSNTTYTLSCWIYLTNYLISTATIRAMTLVTGSPYSNALADNSLLYQWQQVSVTFTTAITQTTATVWLGGIGEAYFDGVMVSPGTTIPTFMLNGLVTLTLDKVMTTLPSPQVYELQICRKYGGIEIKRGITKGNMSADGTVITFGAGWTWDYYPEVYDPYAFGELDNAIKLFRIMSLMTNSEFKFEITAMEYDANVYKIDPTNPESDDISIPNLLKIVPDLDEPIVETFPRALSVTLQEVVQYNHLAGKYDSSIVVKFTPPSDAQNGEWEVSWRDSDADDADLEGAFVLGGEYDQNKIVYFDGGVYISDKMGNLSEPFLYV